MSQKFILPSKLPVYLRRLDLEYKRSGQSHLRDILHVARLHTIEETSYDNWNGGTYGHDAIFYLPENIIGKFSFDEQKQTEEIIKDDLNKCCASVSNEFFNAVVFELVDEADSNFQKSIPFSGRPQTNPDALEIWQPGYIRLFISHRDKHKFAAKQLAEALENYGVSAFVAHDTIQPMTTWQHEIVKGLETMEIMLAFVTDDFHDSSWTNQEIGYALGKGIPIISLKLETKDPSGFIGTIQALKGRLENTSLSVSDIYRLLSEKLGQKDRLEKTLITAFANASDFNEAKSRFDRMSGAVNSLTENDLSFIIDRFKSNDQLHNAIYLINNYNRLKRFLERCTAKKFKIEGRIISELNPYSDDEIPF